MVMNVSLTPELEAMVTEKVKSGLYDSTSEVVREGLRLMREQDQLHEIRSNELRAEIQKGIDSLERGDYSTYNSGQELADELIAELDVKLEYSQGVTA